jgi:hypothetical protein
MVEVFDPAFTRVSILYAAEHFFIITLRGRHRKHRILLSRIVLGVCTAPLHSNSRSMGLIQNSLNIVEAFFPLARVYQAVA